MNLGIKNLKVLVTAGAGGIGLEIARSFVAEGARVHVCDVDKAALRRLAKSDPKITRSVCDVSDRKQVAKLFREALAALKGLDVLVNNAGIAGPTGKVDEIAPEDWDLCLAIDITGQFNCTRLAVPHLRKSGAGRIINLASGAPIKGVPLFLHYVSSKGAVIAMTRGLARELGKDGITVNSLAPGFTLSENVARHPAHVRQGEITRMTRAIPRDEKPEDLVGTVSFLASEDAAFLTGQTIVVENRSRAYCEARQRAGQAQEYGLLRQSLVAATRPARFSPSRHSRRRLRGSSSTR